MIIKSHLCVWGYNTHRVQKAFNDINNHKKQGNQFKKKTIVRYYLYPVQELEMNLSILYTNESLCKYSTDAYRFTCLIMNPVYWTLSSRLVSQTIAFISSGRVYAKQYNWAMFDLHKSNNLCIIKIFKIQRVQRHQIFQPNWLQMGIYNRACSIYWHLCLKWKVLDAQTSSWADFK